MMGRCLFPLPGDTEDKTYEAGVKGNQEHQHQGCWSPRMWLPGGQEMKSLQQEQPEVHQSLGTGRWSGKT